MGGDALIFVTCEKCGKNLIQRLTNGLFRFRFGKGSKGKTPVDMMIHGNIKMTCLRGTCNHVQIINFFNTEKDG